VDQAAFDAEPVEPRASTDRGSTARRLALGTQLRQLREQARLSREDAADALRASPAKISRLELGRVRIKERDVVDLLTLYGISEPAERAEFVELTRESNVPGWWQRYADLLPRWFETYLGLEQACSLIRTYEAQFVPGLFQIPEYARAVTRLSFDDDAEVERRVELRMRRQRILTADDPPTVWAVIDEAALSRPLAGRDLCRAQLDHLIELTELPNVQIQIAPFDSGGHAAAGGPFSILRFREPDIPDIVYLEQLSSAIYLDRRQDVETYLWVMDRLTSQVEQPDKTRPILSELRRRLS